MPGRVSSPALTVGAMFLMFTFAVLIGVTPFAEPDFWWHLRVGEHILDTGQIHGRDPWARFADRPYMATQWLPEAVTAAAYRVFGLGAVLWLRTAAIVAMTVVVYLSCRRFAGRLPAALAAGFAIMGAGASLNPRPQLISFVFFAITMYAWLATTRDLRPRWWLVPLFWVWASSHGLWMFGILLGLVVTAALVADPRIALSRRQALQLVAVNVVSCFAIALTPLGPGLLSAPLTVANTASGIAEEWYPTPLNNAFSITTVSVIVATAILWVRRPQRRPLWQLALLALSAGLTLWMWRLVPLGSILGAPLFASALSEHLPARREGFSRMEKKAILAGTLTALVVAAGAAATSLGERAARYPESMSRISAALREVPSQSVIFADFGVSGWLLWNHPTLTPVMDLRMEMYPADHVAGYIRASAAKPGWDRFVAGTGATYALVERKSAISDALKQRKEWRVIASSPMFLLLEAPEARDR